MNFATYMMTEIARLGSLFHRRGWIEDLPMLAFLNMALQDSVKFLLPANGETGVALKAGDSLNLCRLPYPAVLFEYRMDGKYGMFDGQTKSSQRMCLALQSAYFHDLLKGVPTDHLLSEDSIVFITFAYVDMMKTWMVQPIALIASTTSVLSEHNWIPLERVILLPNHLDDVLRYGTQTKEEFLDALVLDAGDEIKCAINALACLNAKNVRAIDVPPEEKLNRKRIRNGKPPFFEYKVLDIFLGENVRKTVSGGGQRSKAALLEILRTGTRLHAVRGHFKKRKTGLFWWSHFVRGVPKNGMVAKDYNLKE